MSTRLIFRPASTPDLDSEQTGRVWYYLTAGGCKLEPATYVYAKPDPVDEWTVYGAEDDSYIYADDTPKSWENLTARVEECLRARGWTVEDRPDGFMVARTGDGMVQSDSDPHAHIDSLTDVDQLRRVAKGWLDDCARHCRNEMFYRDLLTETGRILGRACYRQDDGNHVDEPLALRVPEVAGDLMRRVRWLVSGGYSEGDRARMEASLLDAEFDKVALDCQPPASPDYEWAARALWQILDDISTLNDACRDNDAAFRKRAYKLTERRSMYAASFDGQTLHFSGSREYAEGMGTKPSEPSVAGVSE